MPSLYHFNSDQFKENLILGSLHQQQQQQQHMVSGRLCQYLKNWQLDGIRFLYKHFEKGEACILNDESGLGKVVTVTVFLGAILTNDTTKKCLIVVQDDESIEGWRFHLSVLTSLTVKVIERTSDINYETVFLIKWSTLKNIGQITKVNFDYIIIDNRGEMLTNKFCTGILLRYYENKASIIISSADVTANLKLLHILLRLCGRIDQEYTDVKAFEDKFQFPKLKDGACSKVDLEDYFLKREKVINFCREFRLRRYCHQFDEEFPLVSKGDFKRHIEHWRSSLNSQSSGSVKLLSSSSEKDIDELFQAYFQVKQERETNKLDREVQQITETAVNDEDMDGISDDVVIMSPLLFVSESESDSEQIQVQTEIINKITDELQKEEEKEKEAKEAVNNEATTLATNRRKSSKPGKRLTLTDDELRKVSLRSRDVIKSSLAINKASEEAATTPARRGRNPMVKLAKNEETRKRIQDEETIKKEKQRSRERKDEQKSTKKETAQTKTSDGNEKEKEKEKRKLSKFEDNKKRTEDEEKGMRDKQNEDKKKLNDKLKISKKSEKKMVKPNEVIESSKKKQSHSERNASNTEMDTSRNKRNELEKDKIISKEDTQMKSYDFDKTKGTAMNTKLQPTKLQKDNKNSAEVTKKEDQKEAATDSEIERAVEEEDWETARFLFAKPGKKLTHSLLIRRSSIEIYRKQRAAIGLDRSKLAKEAENYKRRAKDDNKKKDKENTDSGSKKELSLKNSAKMLDLMFYEANKFMNNKNLSKRKTTKADVISRRTRISNTSTTSPNKPINTADKNVSTPSTTSVSPSKGLKIATKSPRSMSTHKDKITPSKRFKPLTVYTPVGVHSRRTRGMDRCTRSAPTRSKYMKIAIAQVDIDKTLPTKRSTKRRKFSKQNSTSTEMEIKSPPVISESPAVLESMQLGQALTPTNGPLGIDSIVAQPKNIEYNFPLMLDKEISETPECFMTSVNAPNEIIVLTGSSSNENEMEPPKNTVPRRKASAKPPMVAIPRPVFKKSKSPDLFSTCSDLSLPCSQQTNKSLFEGFKIFGSELRQSGKQRSCLEILDRVPDFRNPIVAGKKSVPPKQKETSTQQKQHSSIENEDAMFELTSNGTFGNMVRVNSNGEMSPIRNKNQSTPPSAAHPINRITNYLINSSAHPSSSLEDTADPLPKTPKRRKSISGTIKRSPKSLSGGISGGKSQSTKLTQWLVKNSIVRISETPQKSLVVKRRRLDLSFPDD